MIPTFLNSLAATVRDLVRTGKAVHVNESTAQELDLLAGLPWEHAGDGGIPCALKTAKIAERCHWCRTRNRVTPADLALGWLLASRAMPGWFTDEMELRRERSMRAAECAELAKEAAHMLVLKRAARIVPMPWTAETMGPYLAELQAAATGTREGARAAWGFIHGHMLVEAGNAWDRYRRELEAM